MKNKLSRREFLTRSAAAVAGAAAMALHVPDSHAFDKKEDAFVTDFTPPKKCFMDQYYDGILKIAEGIRKTEIGNISKAMEKAYELKRKGGSINSHVVYGHYSMFAGSIDRPGQPWVLHSAGSLQQRKSSMP